MNLPHEGQPSNKRENGVVCSACAAWNLGEGQGINLAFLEYLAGQIALIGQLDAIGDDDAAIVEMNGLSRCDAQAGSRHR